MTNCRRCKAPMDGSPSSACGLNEPKHPHRPSASDATVCDVMHCQYVEEINRRVDAGTFKIVPLESFKVEGVRSIQPYYNVTHLDGVIQYPAAIEAVCETCGEDVNWEPVGGLSAPQCKGCGFVGCSKHLKEHGESCEGDA